MGILGKLFNESMEAGASGYDMLVEVSQAVEATAVAGMDVVSDTTSNLADGAASLAEKIYQKHMGITQDVVDGVVDGATATVADILKRLPLESTGDMPPEVQSLIEVRAVDEKLTSCVAELHEQGSLDEVMRYLASQPPMEEEPPRRQAQPELDPGESPEVKFSLPKLG